jgi:hypothetical protein
MLCAAHPEIEARGPCAICFKNLCDACATYDLDGATCCERCGRDKEDESHALSSGLLALIGVGYLATLAVGVVIWKPRAFVGGLAAIVAIALGRLMQLFVKTPVVTRRVSGAGTGKTGSGDATATAAGETAPAVDATEQPL